MSFTNTFASQVGPIPLAYLDQNFSDISTGAANKGAYLVGDISTAAGAVATTQHEINSRSMSVFGCMTAAQIADVRARTRTMDVTAAVVAAAAGAGVGEKLVFPPGDYLLTSKVALTTSHTVWEGAGRYLTRFYFAPTAASTCVEMGTTGADIVGSAIKGIGFYSDDSTYKKIAIDCIRTSQCEIEGVAISGGVVVSSTNFWSGASSVGIRTRGHDSTAFRDIYSAADIPLQISKTAARPTVVIDIDHFNFHNFYLIANGNPKVTIDDGVNLTQVSFTGYQAWVLGTAGLRWVDTTSTLASSGLLIENLRAEQSTDANSYTVDIQHNTQLTQLKLTGYLDPNMKGMKFRKCLNTKFDQTVYTSAVGEALNIDATVKGLTGSQCFWAAGSTVTATGQRLIYGSPKNPNSGPLPPNFIYDESANTKADAAMDVGMGGSIITLANNATDTSLGAVAIGGLEIASNSGAAASFQIAGGSVVLSSQVGTSFTTTLTTANKINVGYSGGLYTIENKTGGSINIRYLLNGSLSSF